MPNYGDEKYCAQHAYEMFNIFNRYWNERYASDLGGPFDWLFEYKDVRPVIHQLIPKDADILMVGAGSANFSRDMYSFTYNLILPHACQVS